MNNPAHMDEAPPTEENPQDSVKTINPVLEPYRELPRNLEVEQALLGAVFVGGAVVLDKVSGFLKAEHFYEPVHERIYQACLTLHHKNQGFNPVKLKTYFENADELRDVGGAAYLVRLAASAATIINAEDYGRTIHWMWKRRRVIEVCAELSELAYIHELEIGADVNVELVDYVEDATDILEGLSLRSGGDGLPPYSFSEAVDLATESMRCAHEGGGTVGTSSGLADLDRKIGGFVPGDLVILAGRPSMGKTALALHFAKACAKGGKTAHFFTLESSARRLSMRALAMLAADMGFDVAYADAWQGRLNMADRSVMQQAGELNRSLPLFIHDVSQLSPAQLKGRLRRAAKSGEIGLVIVDYLQIMTPPFRKNYQSNRTGDVTELSRALKSIAKQFDVPLIALSQLSRLVESRDNKRPLLSDLRESGALEQDADMVLMVYRHIYYLEKHRPKKNTPAYAEWELEMAECLNQVEVLICKQRDGPSGIGIKIYGNMPSNDFRDLGHGQR